MTLGNGNVAGRKAVAICVVLAAIIISILFTCALPASAATAVKLKVPWDRTYLYWTSAQVKGGSPQQSAPDRFKGKTATLELDAAKGPVTLTVYDATTGNEAVETLKPPFDPKGISLQPRDFDEVRRVQLKITADKGKPVESALVTLTDITNKAKSAYVDPTTGGIAEFTDVTMGDASVTVLYGDGKKMTVDVTIDEERDTPVFFYEIPVAGPVKTIAETKAGAAAEETAGEAKEEKSRKSGSEFAVALVSTLFGFIILVGIIIAIILYVRSKGVTLEQSLKKMGVELPENAPADSTQQAPAAPAVDPTICQFCGQKKDPVSGACACSVSAAPAPPAAGSGPRLIGTQGVHAMRIIELNTDVTTIGREPDNIIALSEDSTVSRHHARIIKAGGSFLVRDEGSSNGTFVNGDKITERPLQPGDEIQVGTSRFRFEL